MDKAATAGGRSDRVHDGGGSADSAPGPPGGSGLTRVTVNLNRKAMEALDALSESNGLSKTDTINRALQVYALIQDIMDRNGGSLVIKYSDGQIERVHIV
jgi:hypothetical protein